MAPPPAARDARHTVLGSAWSSVLLNSDLARPKNGVPAAPSANSDRARSMPGVNRKLCTTV